MSKVEAQYLVEGDILRLGVESLRVTSLARAGHRILISLEDRSAMSVWRDEEVELVNL